MSHKPSSPLTPCLELHSKLKVLHMVFVVILSTFFFFVVATPDTSAQTYKLLAPLPQGQATVPVEEGFSIYAANLYWFLLSVAVILALIMLVIGGVEYVGSAGNTSLVGDAKGRMLNALMGLLLALAAWLILNLINPDLVDFKIDIPEIPGLPNASSGVIGGGTSTAPPLPSTTPPLTPGTTNPPGSPGPTPTPPSTTIPPGNPNPGPTAPGNVLEVPPVPPANP